MPRLRFPARDASQCHTTVPVHDDQILRATAICDALASRGTWVERTDLLRAAAAIGLLAVTRDACHARVACPRSPSGAVAAIVIAFPRTLAHRARDLGLASASATIRAAIDAGLGAYESA